MNASKPVTTKEADDIFFVCINRPEKRNCVNHETAKALLQAFHTFNDTPEHRIAILYGQGLNFCAGYDLQEVADEKHMQQEKEFVEFIQNNRFLGPTNMKIKKPVIAAVEGYAVAGGLELALMADLRVVSENATLGVFCRRVGVPLIDGGTVRLPKVVGLSRALDMILTGRAVGAREALDMGLANRVVPQGKALEEATILAKDILKHPQRCMLTDRASVFHSLQTSFDEAMQYEYINGTQILEESIQGAKKFTARRQSNKSKL